MKKLIKFILFFPLLSLIVSLFFAYCEGRGTQDASFSCLFMGYDAVAENTDVIFVVSYNSPENEISFVQIPRDSFTEYKREYGKINRIYSSSRASGKDRDEASRVLKSAVEDYLGIDIDAYVSLSFGALIRFVDEIGGVYINIPESARLENFPIELSYGENILNGKKALQFVRERSIYPNADLGRLDTQKIFLEGVFHTMFERLSAKKLVKLILTKDHEVAVDAPLLELSGMLLKNFNEIKSAKTFLLTLPGEACKYNGVSYYVINRRAAIDAVENYLYGYGENFDRKYRLTDESEPEINDIYKKEDFSYKVYSDGKVIDIN